MRRWRPLLAALVLGSTLACGGGPEAPRPPNVVMIVVDTLRADRLGSYGHARDTSPAIDRFAADAIRFERAYASAPWTKPSVASLLTGLHPTSHGVLHLERSLPASATTLGERLAAAGYRTGAVVSHHVIGSEYGFDQGFEHFVEDEAKGHMHVSTQPVTREALELLDRLSDADAPFFLFVHYFDPHFFYLGHPEYGFAGARPERIGWNRGITGLRLLDPPPTDDEIGWLLDVYDEEIRYTDAGIGALLDGLRERGLYDDALVALTADHGEEFYEHGWLGHTIDLTEELMRVPLVLRLPGGRGGARVVREPVSLVALTATVLDVAGVAAAPGALQEGSLLPWLGAGAAAPAAPVFVEVDFERHFRNALRDRFPPRHRAAVLSGPFKLVLDKRSGAVALYDVVRDPTEDRDVAGAHPDVVARLLPVLRAQQARLGPAALAPDARELTPEQEQMLRGLGYLDEADEPR